MIDWYSTTVAMAIHGLRWKLENFIPDRSHPSEPIEKQVETIDYVINENALSKFGCDETGGLRYTWINPNILY